MKAQLFASAALVLLNAIPGALSAEPQLRGVILATDFEDQLALYDPKDEDLSEDFDFEATEPYEEDDFDSSDFDKMEPYEEDFYHHTRKRRSSKPRRNGGNSSGGSSVCDGGQASNCGSHSTDEIHCTWTDNGCVARDGIDMV
mmetsp:Transcript_30599/g.61397  ORF Transcript_30599/g.61397 Transcript_30599/m.61397 type:complete len:143 (-) Transcript_30599:1350-1778(-)